MKLITLKYPKILKPLVCIFSILIVASCSSTTKSPTTSPVRVNSPSKTTQTTKPGDIKLCKMKVSNAPQNNNGLILRKSPNACVAGINILIAPAPKACLSSGYGKRYNRPHSGIDYQSKPAGKVVAAGNGTVIDVLNRPKDYGHWVIIDHGKGVYSSYAHLENVARDIKKGNKITKGQTLGKMGQSGNAAQAIHLHFEVRTGDYSNRKKWWGLNPINLFNQPVRC